MIPYYPYDKAPMPLDSFDKGRLIHSIPIDDDHQLKFHENAVCYGERCLKLSDIISLRVYEKDVHVKGLWMGCDRNITIKGTTGELYVLCDIATPFTPSSPSTNGEIFANVVAAVDSFIGARLVDKLLQRITSGEKLSFDEIEVSEKGASVGGLWKFLWWKSKTKLIPWQDVRASISGTVLHVSSRSDSRFRSQIDINAHDNVTVLYTLIRQKTGYIEEEPDHGRL